MNSLPFDWQAHRFIELHVSFFLLEGLYVPSLSDDDYAQIAHAATGLSAVDDRFADFARETGVECGPLLDADRMELRLEIDARVARAWGLGPDDLEVIYEDFTHAALPPAYRTRLTERLKGFDVKNGVRITSSCPPASASSAPLDTHVIVEDGRRTPTFTERRSQCTS